MSTPVAIEVDQFLAHPPARVWRALTDPNLLARWLMPNNFEPRVGHRFELDAGSWGTTRCQVLLIEEEKLLRVSWRNDPLDTVVTWRLEPEGVGTRLFVKHAGFEVDHSPQRLAFDAMHKGWSGGIAQALSDLLETMAS